MAKSEFLLLAHVFNPDKHWIAGWFMSEKLDGSRCVWDGGISRGLAISAVPYANHDKKAHRLSEPVATGLWSRYGNAIQAPAWFLDSLPPAILDGELWGGRGGFQTLRSVVSAQVPDDRWKDITFRVFDAPGLSSLFSPRLINTTNFKKQITPDWALNAWHAGVGPVVPETRSFETTAAYLANLLATNPWAKAHQQVRLPYSEEGARAAVAEELQDITSKGGEGLMLRAPHSLWLPERSHHLVKVKKLLDTEGVITGFTSGRETDKGSRLLGMIGALILDYNGKRLELSGLTDAEREFDSIDAVAWAKANPGKDMPPWAEGLALRKGETVSFHYRELSDDGLPKEARFWRK